MIKLNEDPESFPCVNYEALKSWVRSNTVLSSEIWWGYTLDEELIRESSPKLKANLFGQSPNGSRSYDGLGLNGHTEGYNLRIDHILSFVKHVFIKYQPLLRSHILT